MLLPIVFLLLWSSGFSVARIGLDYVEPLTFLAMRYVCVVGLLSAEVFALIASMQPVLVAVISPLAVGEQVMLHLAWAGLALAAFGVWLANRPTISVRRHSREEL